MLSRKHYVVIAAVIDNARKDASRTAFDVNGAAACSKITHELANYFASDNPAFNRAKFLAACGVQS